MTTTNTAHANCTHPATAAARTACRKMNHLANVARDLNLKVINCKVDEPKVSQVWIDPAKYGPVRGILVTAETGTPVVTVTYNGGRKFDYVSLSDARALIEELAR